MGAEGSFHHYTSKWEWFYAGLPREGRLLPDPRLRGAPKALNDSVIIFQFQNDVTRKPHFPHLPWASYELSLDLILVSFLKA